MTKEPSDDAARRHARAANMTCEEMDGSLGRSRAALGRLYWKALAILIPVGVVIYLLYRWRII